MSDLMSTGKSKASAVVDVINKTIFGLIQRSTKADGVRDHFDLGIIGYGGDGVGNVFPGVLGNKVLNPVSMLEANPLRIEERVKRMDDGAGGVLEQTVKFPVWFDPKASGGTPMCQAIRQAAAELAEWCDSHPDNYPPTVFHVTDGESTDGDPETLAAQLCQIQTSDGQVLMMNLHLSSLAGNPIAYPSGESGLPDNFAKMLFRMSSVLPEKVVAMAQEKSFPASFESRGFMFNVIDSVHVVDFIDIGTRAAQMR
jgi:hypothetical protein